MTVPKVRMDWTVNLTHVILIVSTAFAITWTWQDSQRTLREHAEAITELKSEWKGLSPRLSVIETKMTYMAEGVERIDRRTEARASR